MDMTETVVINSDQINYEDFLSGPRTFTITEVRHGSSEQPVWIFFAEVEGKSFRPAKTVRKLLLLAYGANSDDWIGKRLTLYGDPDVKWAGKKIGGIRVSHGSGISKPVIVALSETRGKREVHRLEPLPDAPEAPVRPQTPMDALVAAFVEAKISDAGERLAYCRWVVERDITSARDLTEAELAEVRQALQDGVRPAPVPGVQA